MQRRLWKTPYPYIPIVIIVIFVAVTILSSQYVNQTVDVAIVKAVEKTAIRTAIKELPYSKSPIIVKYTPNHYQQNVVSKFAKQLWTTELKTQLHNAPIESIHVNKFQITFAGPS